MMHSMTIADRAASYCRDYGIALVPLPPRQKRPLAADWGRHVIADADVARDYYAAHPDANIGAALGPSRLCSLDVDDIDAMRMICDEYGWSLDALRATNPTIEGAPGGLRIMFRVPDDVSLPYHSLTWRAKDSKARVTVFELRAADRGQQRQDVLPPSIHPDTQRPYQWITAPEDVGGFHAPPGWVLALWNNWAALKQQLQDLCPWDEDRKRKDTRPRTVKRTGSGESIIENYDRAHDIESVLSRYGYTRQGNRWLSPHSTTKLPGVVIYRDTNRCWIHHASDPLCSDESLHPVGPFDLFSYYEHNGDQSAAARAAADILGMTRRAPVQAPRPMPRQAAAVVEHGGAVDLLASVDTQSPLREVNGKGRPLATIENLQEILDRIGATVRFDEIRKQEEINIPGMRSSIDNRHNAALGTLLSWCKRFGFPTGDLQALVTTIASANTYNPVAEWICSQPWDGVPRWDAFVDTVKAVGESTDPRIGQSRRIFMRRWMLSAVAAGFEKEGVAAQGVLVFQGPQALGKTSWFKRLVPADLALVQDGLTLQPNDKDSVRQATMHWLVELGELDATFRRSDIAQLKSFLTRQIDIYRRSYARSESHSPRRTVYFASVNPSEFLFDSTGNRRFWTVACESIDYRHTFDMQQVWSEVFAAYQAGESWALQPEEQAALNESNEDHAVTDPVADSLADAFDWDAPVTLWQWITPTHALRIAGNAHPSQSDAMRAAHHIRRRNGGQCRKSSGARLLLMPPAKKVY